MDESQIKIGDAFLKYLKGLKNDSANSDQYSDLFEKLNCDKHIQDQIINFLLDHDLIKFEGKESYFLRLAPEGYKAAKNLKRYLSRPERMRILKIIEIIALVITAIVAIITYLF